MKLEHAKILFDAGSLKWAGAFPAPMQTGWLLTITQGNGQSYTLEKARGGDRVFKTLDAVAAAAGVIGFQTLNIQLQTDQTRKTKSFEYYGDISR